MDVREAARRYITLGYQVVPIPAGGKGPRRFGWQAGGHGPEDFGPGDNIGLLLGEPSGGLVDVDLDCAEALELADTFLPHTGAVTGHASSPASHRWYIADGGTTPRQWRDTADKSMIVELRSTGQQTVVGPSVHPSGEPVDELLGDPARVSGEDLRRAVARLAAAVLERRGRTAPVATRVVRSKPSAYPADDQTPPVDRVLDALREAGRAVREKAGGWIAQCPAHDDHNPSLKIDRGDDGRALIHCYAGCSCDQVTDALGLGLVDLMPIADRPASHDVDLSMFDPHARPAPTTGDGGQESDFPVELLDVGGLIGDVVRHIVDTAQRPQPVLALAAAISLQGVLAARKIKDDYGNRTNVYTIGVAPSGAGKDHARRKVRALLRDAGAEMLEGNDEIASDTGLMVTVEQSPACLFQIDEFGRFLRTLGSPSKAPHLYAVASCLLKLYSSAGGLWRGKAYAVAERTKMIDQPCVLLHATTVPSHLMEGLTTEAMEDGFLARLLIFEANGRPEPRLPRETDAPSHIIERIQEWANFAPGGNLNHQHPQPVPVRHSPGADKAVRDYLLRTERRLRESDSAAQAVWSRAVEKACRLALIAASSRGVANLRIEEHDVLWASALVDHLTERTLRMAGAWIAENAFDRIQKKVVRSIEDAGGEISQRDLTRRLQAYKPRERKEVVENLIATGQILVSQELTSQKGTTMYTLMRGSNP